MKSSLFDVRKCSAGRGVHFTLERKLHCLVCVYTERITFLSYQQKKHLPHNGAVKRIFAYGTAEHKDSKCSSKYNNELRDFLCGLAVLKEGSGRLSSANDDPFIVNHAFFYHSYLPRMISSPLCCSVIEFKMPMIILFCSNCASSFII